MVPTLPSPFFQPIRKILVVFSILNTNLFSSFVLSESFESCGIFLQNFEAYSNKQGDINHELIDYLHLEQNGLQSLIIKNELSKRDIHPTNFRSMKYDCYLYVHINFGKDLFTTLPSIDSPFRAALYKKALFLMIVEVNDKQMFTGESWYSQFDRQYIIFVVNNNNNIY